jgi:hypothetical protein
MITYVEDLMRENYEAVGFIPKPRLEHYGRSGQILLESENGELCGYLIFGNGCQRLKVYQACIQHDARRRQHGLSLVGRLIKEASIRRCEMISLWCADDLDANGFWKEAGFMFGTQRKGGKKRDRMHNLWIMRLPTPQLRLDL